MAAENVGSVVYTVEADTSKLVNGEKAATDSFNKLSDGADKADKATGKLNTELTQTAKAAKQASAGVQAASNGMSALYKIAAAYMTLGLLKEMAALADQYGQNADRIKNATSSAEEYNMVQERLLKTANGTYRALSEAQEVYLGTADVLRDLGYTTSQVLDVTDSFSYALVRDAARADQATSAMDAYSKALQKGKIDADAWASIMAATPSIVNGIAEATGRSAQEIRKLGAEGKLSVEALNEGLLGSLNANKQAADGMAVSTRDAVTAMSNSLTVFVGKVDEAAGGSKLFGETVADFSALLQDPATIDAAVKMATGVLKAINWIIEGAKNLVNVTRWMAENVAAAFHGAAAGDIVRLEDQLAQLQQQKKNLDSTFGGAFGRLFKSPEDVQKEIDQTKKLIDDYYKNAVSAAKDANAEIEKITAPVNRPKVNAESPSSKKGKGGKSKADKAAESAERYISALREQAEAVRNATAQERVASDVLSGKVKLQQGQIKAALDLASAIDAQTNNEVIAKLSQELLMAGMNAKDLAETQAVMSLNQYATPEQVEAVRLLSNELYEAEKRAAKVREMGDDVAKWIKGDVSPMSGGGFDDQQARYDQEAIKEQERYAAQLERLTAALELEKLTRAEYLAQFEQMQITHNDRMAAIDDARSTVMRKQYADAFGAVADILKNAKGEQSNAYRAMFAVSKSFAIADATVNAYNAISKAWASAPFPANLAAVAATAPQVMGVVSSIASVSAGRQYGGPVNAGSMYRINENGAPEVFNAANGQQYMLPNRRGEVVSNKDATSSSGGGAPTIVVNLIESKEGAGSVQQEQGSNDEYVVNVVVASIMGDGPVGQAVQGKWGLSPQGV